jgi:hypothetical protein
MGKIESLERLKSADRDNKGKDGSLTSTYLKAVYPNFISVQEGDKRSWGRMSMLVFSIPSLLVFRKEKNFITVQIKDGIFPSLFGPFWKQTILLEPLNQTGPKFGGKVKSHSKVANSG